MSRSRLAAVVAAAVVAVGAATGVGVYYLDPARAAVGPLPAEALSLPASATFVAGVDVRRFVASPLYKKMREGQADQKALPWGDIEAKTGVDIQRDVDRVVLAGSAGAERSVVLVSGRFDVARIEQSARGEKAVTAKKVEGATVYYSNQAAGAPFAMAVLDRGSLAMGPSRAVEEVLANRASGAR